VFFDEETLTQFQVPFYQISMETGVAVVTERKVSKYELSYETGMPLRDLRPFTHQLNRRVQVAALVTRPRSFLVNFEPLQAIVMPDRLQIFNVEPEDQPYMTALMRKLQRPSQAAFEHRSLECVLSITVKKLEQEASSFDDRLTSVLNNATRNPSSQNLWDLREISDTIEAHGAYVRQALSAITGVLQKDELMNMMYLARNQTGKVVNDHRDVELILEAAEDRLQALDHSCVMSQSRITNAEQYLAVSNDTQRNEIIRVTLYATIISLGFSAVAVVGSIFGMNLNSGWETDPEMFLGVVVAMGFLFLGVLAEGAFMIRRIDADRPRSKAGRTFKF
jgi:magnesium transporter